MPEKHPQLSAAPLADSGDFALRTSTGTDASDPSDKPVARTAINRATWPVPDYDPVMLCGEGSFGAVYAVRDRVGVFRAMKLIDLDKHRKSQHECYELNALQTYCRRVSRHPYLITIYHVGVVGSHLYYTMELADHQAGPGRVGDQLPPDYKPLTLRTVIKKRRLHVDLALEIALRLLRGLAKLHELELVHRDIKPSNIIFVDKQPKLADIGVITTTDAAGRSVGTPRYMPPDKVMDKTGDTFAMGKILYEMIAGMDGKTFPELPEAALEGSARWNISRVNEVIGHAASPRAADRYPSASAMLEAVEACAQLSFGSLFDELAPRAQPREPSTKRAVIQITLALIDKIPWIAGFFVALYAVSKLMQ